FGLFCVFLIVFALHDVVVSRSFFFSYIPCLYLTLVFSNYFVPRSLGRWAFSGVHEERVALAGTEVQAAELEPWLARKRLLGLKTVGLITMTSRNLAKPTLERDQEGAELSAAVGWEQMPGLTHAAIELGHGSFPNQVAPSAQLPIGSHDLEQGGR